MAIAQQLTAKQVPEKIPSTMLAAVYRGKDDVRLETVPVPEIRRGEILVKVHTCGICGTDLKKIATGSHSAPRIFGHETAGTVVATGLPDKSVIGRVNTADRDWYQALMLTDRPFLGQAVQARTTDHLIVPFGAPSSARRSSWSPRWPARLPLPRASRSLPT